MQRVWWLVLVLALFVGCTGRGSSVPVEPPPASSAAKSALEGIAASGELGSATDEVKMQLEAMKETDPAKANELLADYNELVALSDPAAIKAKAKEMAGKL